MQYLRVDVYGAGLRQLVVQPVFGEGRRVVPRAGKGTGALHTGAAECYSISRFRMAAALSLEDAGGNVFLPGGRERMRRWNGRRSVTTN